MQMPPPTGDKHFRNETLAISSLTVNTAVLEGLTFQNCRLVGPAILIPLGATSFLHCNLGADIDAIFWEIPPGRDHVVGAVGVLNCTFSACTLAGIGLAGSAELRQLLERGSR
jgi:hypothetical protein